MGQQLSALHFIDACTMTLSRLTIFHSPLPWSTRANMTQTCRRRWPSTRGQLHPDRLCDDPWLLHLPFFLVALTATLLPLQPVGPDGLRIMIGASARQEPGSEDTRPVRGENPEFLHTVTTTRRNFERQFSPVRRPCGCGSSSVSRVAAGLSSPPRQSSGSGVGAVSV